jgi:hypothetical protein
MSSFVPSFKKYLHESVLIIGQQISFWFILYSLSILFKKRTMRFWYRGGCNRL